MRSPLPRAVLNRLETGRLVVLSVLLGALVGGLSIILRLILDAAVRLGTLITDYAPPGTTAVRMIRTDSAPGHHGRGRCLLAGMGYLAAA